MTQTEQLVTTEIRKDLPASVERTWRWFTEGDRVASWGCGHRYTHVAIDLDVREGGVYHHRVKGKEDGTPWTFHGVYQEVTGPHRLVYTFDWKSDWRDPPTPSLVEIDFAPSGEGTRVTVTHSQLPTMAVQSTDEHWNEFLGLLAELLQEA
ncbi:MAG: SRPBCC family protein [Thermoplasmata archaeon]|nr:SRPBCC family protein [Thermoplasmata archaeon]